jgi:hypothetical protein
VGLPVVAFDTPISHEYLGDLGLYADRGNSRSLAAQLLASLDNPDGSRQLGLRLRGKAVKELSWDEAITGIEQVYERARARRAGQSHDSIVPVATHQSELVPTSQLGQGPDGPALLPDCDQNVSPEAPVLVPAVTPRRASASILTSSNGRKGQALQAQSALDSSLSSE